MIVKFVEQRGRIGGSRGTRWTLKAATWACLVGAALTVNLAAQAESFNFASEGKIDRFLRPQIGQMPQIGLIPMWTQVEPGKAEIFKRPTPAAPAEEIECLALNIYFEARGEPVTGQLAVGHVVMNRVASARFPSTVCGVVQQGGELRRYRCQFSWWCDGLSDRPDDAGAWEDSKDLAGKILAGGLEDPTRGALWYHADRVTPDWQTDIVRQGKIGRHIFYVRQSR